MFNEIDGEFDDVAISIFKLDLPVEHGLRKSLTGKPVTSVCQLMDQIDKYKRVEEILPLVIQGRQRVCGFKNLCLQNHMDSNNVAI